LPHPADSSTAGNGSGEKALAGKTIADAVSQYGASTKSKLSSAAISGAPEDQLRGPLELRDSKKTWCSLVYMCR
jgi:hypothetical protein